jgi:hypothetical protein
MALSRSAGVRPGSEAIERTAIDSDDVQETCPMKTSARDREFAVPGARFRAASQGRGNSFAIRVGPSGFWWEVSKNVSK